MLSYEYLWEQEQKNRDRELRRSNYRVATNRAVVRWMRGVFDRIVAGTDRCCVFTDHDIVSDDGDLPATADCTGN